MVDYKKEGLKAGLEIHQQLDTGKLFSRTPGYLRSDKPDYEIHRKLHKVAGELGEVDIAVEFEAARGKEFVYQGYDDTISLVELDEAPPRPIDDDALNEALKIALLLNCEIYSTTQVMRKTVIDGSNTSGFQRTVMIAHSGFVETGFGKVGIESIALEEDAARIINRGKNRVVYRLDRLGIPLVEITTEPVLDTAEKIKETALKIGEILRSCKVKRGIGTIRQDLNISIKGHGRVEIKGFQDPKMMIKTVNLEISRQKRDLKKKNKKGEVRKALDTGKTEFLRPLPGGARMYPETDLPLLRISRDRINMVKKALPRLRGEIKEDLKKSGLSEELIALVLKSNRVDEFSALMKVYDKDSNLVGKMITLWRTDEKKLNEDVLEDILKALKEGKISKGDVRDVMKEIAAGKKLEDAIKAEKISDDELEHEIRKIIKKKPGLRPNAYMGLVMKEFKGKLDAKKAMEIINKILENE